MENVKSKIENLFLRWNWSSNHPPMSRAKMVLQYAWIEPTDMANVDENLKTVLDASE